MEAWIPLLAALVGAITALGVAFWNSRGDFAELRQLKTMNEVLSTMSDSAQKEAFEIARDGLAVRVAERVTLAPKRRRLVRLIVSIALAVGSVAFAAVLLAPVLPAWASDEETLNWLALGSGIVTTGLALAATSLTTSLTRSRESAARRALLDAIEGAHKVADKAAKKRAASDLGG